MKKLYFLPFLILLLSLQIHAQLKDSQLKYKAVISAEAMNVIYAGIDNPVSVAVPGYFSNQLSVSINYGEIRGDSGNYIIAVPTHPDTLKKIIISVHIKKNDSSRFLAEKKEFVIRKIPRPDVFFGNCRDGGISIEEAENNDFLKVENIGFYFKNLNWYITGFEFVYAPKSGKAMFAKSRSNYLTPEMKGFLKDLKKGDRLIFVNIWARLDNGTEIRMGDMILTVL